MTKKNTSGVSPKTTMYAAFGLDENEPDSGPTRVTITGTSRDGSPVEFVYIKTMKDGVETIQGEDGNILLERYKAKNDD